MINERYVTKLKFPISWLVASVSMFTASYLWHGVFLNDFSKVEYHHGILFTITAVVYLFIGFIVAKAYEIRLIPYLNIKPRIKGLAVGMFCGFIIYITTLVIGVSFTNHLTLDVMLFDMSWQVLEQSIGGVCVGYIHYIIFQLGYLHTDQ